LLQSLSIAKKHRCQSEPKTKVTRTKTVDRKRKAKQPFSGTHYPEPKRKRKEIDIKNLGSNRRTLKKTIKPTATQVNEKDVSFPDKKELIRLDFK
jgi:hypothetical protein